MACLGACVSCRPLMKPQQDFLSYLGTLLCCLNIVQKTSIIFTYSVENKAIFLQEANNNNNNNKNQKSNLQTLAAQAESRGGVRRSLIGRMPLRKELLDRLHFPASWEGLLAPVSIPGGSEVGLPWHMLGHDWQRATHRSPYLDHEALGLFV